MAIIGNTVRLIAEFKTFAGVFSDATSITLLIKDNDGTTLKTLSYPADITRISSGKYYYDFTVPAGSGKINYVWSALLENSPIVNRNYITREFEKDAE